MNKFTTALRKAKDPKRVLLFIMRHTAKLWCNDERYQRVFYFISTGKKLNLDNPQTFNEKLQWLKLNNRREEYTQLVDKYGVKRYLQSIGGGSY